MKRVSIQDLKATLSSVIADVEAGATVIVTRHNAPVAMLNPASSPQVHRGGRVGTAGLRAVLKRGTRGRALAVLAEDRGDR